MLQEGEPAEGVVGVVGDQAAGVGALGEVGGGVVLVGGDPAQGVAYPLL